MKYAQVIRRHIDKVPAHSAAEGNFITPFNLTLFIA